MADHETSVKLDSRARQGSTTILDCWLVTCVCGWRDKTTTEASAEALGQRHKDNPARYRYKHGRYS